jgi:PAS domain S-box-containing protein/diguanylate cyclase (GGDEF)-like protein
VVLPAPIVPSAAVLDALPAAVLVVDAEGTIRWCSEPAATLLGRPASELVGAPVTTVVTTESSSALQRALAEAPHDGDVVLQPPAGVGRPAHVRTAPVTSDDGASATVVVLTEPARELERLRLEADARFARSPVAQAALDPSGRITAANPALCRLSGYSEDELRGRPATDFMPSEDLPEASARLERLGTGAQCGSEHRRRLRRADGSYRVAEISIVAITDSRGEVVALEAVLEDVTAAVTAEQELHAAQQRWEALVRHAADVAFLATAQGEVVYASDAALERFGSTAEQVIGRIGFDFYHADDIALVREAWQRAVQGGASPVVFEARLRHGDGSWRWVQETVTNRLDDPLIAAMVANVVDVTDRRAAMELLAAREQHDPLTGLPTRWTLVGHLESEAVRQHAAVILLDLDDLRSVNELHGHQAGDEILTVTAARLQELTPPGGLLCRLAGDTFALVTTDVADEAGLHALITRLQDAVGQPVAVGGRSLRVTASGGACLDGGDGPGLLTSSEMALAEARRHGPASVHLAVSGAEDVAVARARTIGELRTALVGGQITAYFQPVIDLATGEPVGVEALARWEYPERGLLLPASFIDAAESSGLIIEVGAQVLRAACRAAARWAPHGTPDEPFHVAVNLSARQLAEPAVVELVQACLAESGVPAQALVLEVTETSVLADVAAVGRTLEALRALGVGLAVDDFGTGYSSLTYLKHFPVTSLKIDRSFVAGLGLDTDDTAIVASVISLGDRIGMPCVAEGVESDRQRQALERLGCRYAQGFLWSRPLPADEMHRWLAGDRTAPAPADEPEPSVPDVVDRAGANSAPDDRETRARIAALQADGASLHTIAAALNTAGVAAPGGKRWHPRSVARVVARMHVDAKDGRRRR